MKEALVCGNFLNSLALRLAGAVGRTVQSQKSVGTGDQSKAEVGVGCSCPVPSELFDDEMDAYSFLSI